MLPKFFYNQISGTKTNKPQNLYPKKMSYEEWGDEYADYGEENYDYDDYGDGDPDEGMILERNKTSELQSMRNFKHVLLEQKTLKSNLESKVKNLAQEFLDFRLDTGDYWNALRQNQFSVRGAKTWLNDKIIELMDTKTMHDIPPANYRDCLICYDTFPSHQVMQAGCGHFFCEDCYVHYVTEKIKTKLPNEVVEMKCPSRKCPFWVWDNLIAKLLGNNSKIYERYQRFLLDDFVDKSPTIIFCPSPDCPTATEVDDKMLSRSGRLPQKDVVCSCNNLICLRCEALGHEPLGCEIFEEWEENLDKKKDQLSGFWMKR
jgi:hypothetical protein